MALSYRLSPGEILTTILGWIVHFECFCNLQHILRHLAYVKGNEQGDLPNLTWPLSVKRIFAPFGGKKLDLMYDITITITLLHDFEYKCFYEYGHPWFGPGGGGLHNLTIGYYSCVLHTFTLYTKKAGMAVLYIHKMQNCPQDNNYSTTCPYIKIKANTLERRS